MSQFQVTETMVYGAMIASIIAIGVGVLLRRRVGAVCGFAIAGFGLSVVVIGLITLLPLDLAHGGRAPGAPARCYTDVGNLGVANFWRFDGGQRFLNTVLFVPSGALLILAVSRWRSRWFRGILGLLALCGYSLAIELAQLSASGLTRTCDLTDVVANVLGVLLGASIGVVLAAGLRRWKQFDQASESRESVTQSS